MKMGEVCRNYELDWMACDDGAPLGRIDADYLILQAKGEMSYLEKLVPAPLEATEDVIIYMGWFKETVKDGVTTWAYPFHEWGIGISAKMKEPPYAEGNFLVQLYVDDDLVLVHGREVWGYPKKMAQLSISPPTSEDSASYEFSVERRGAHLISGRVDNLRPIDVQDFPFFGTKNVLCFRQTPANVRVGLEKQEIVFVRVDFEAADTMKGEGAIAIDDGPFDQIPIGPLTDMTSYFGRCTFNHHDVSPRVVMAEELSRPLDLSKAGKTPATR